MSQPMLRRFLQVALLAALILALSGAAVAADELRVHFLDVGQGDSELLQFAGKNILIDAGSEDMGPRVADYLRSHGVTSLDLVVATHPHEDHIGGLLTILREFPVGQVLDSGQVHTTSTFETFLNIIDQKNIPYAVAQRGQTINLDPRLRIEVLSPPQQSLGSLNENSIVLKVTYGSISFLLMGDAGIAAEQNLLASGYVLDSDILKVGHHGSSSASSTSFLQAVSPVVSIIEVGAGNDYGHPSQETLSNLQRVGSKIYRTDLNGNIVVTTDGQTYSVSTQKQSSEPAGSTALLTSSPQGIVSANTGSGCVFVGSSKSDKYHYPSCEWAQKIKPSNLVCFSSSEDARAHGYVPCKVCNPP